MKKTLMITFCSTLSLVLNASDIRAEDKIWEGIERCVAKFEQEFYSNSKLVIKLRRSGLNSELNQVIQGLGYANNNYYPKKPQAFLDACERALGQIKGAVDKDTETYKKYVDSQRLIRERADALSKKLR